MLKFRRHFTFSPSLHAFTHLPDSKTFPSSYSAEMRLRSSTQNSELSLDSFAVVVSRYNENPFWVLEDSTLTDFSKTIYNKGASLTVPQGKEGSVDLIEISNVGREGHTYLHHIVENYDKLAPVTIFLPASSACCEVRNRRVHEIIERVKQTGSSVFLCSIHSRNIKDVFSDFQITEWVGSNGDNARTAESKAATSLIARPYNKWFEHFFNDIDIHAVSFNGIFAVSRDHILQHPRGYYQALRDSVGHHSNPEDGHYLERSWIAVFHPLPQECITPWKYDFDVTSIDGDTEEHVEVQVEDEQVKTTYVSAADKIKEVRSMFSWLKREAQAHVLVIIVLLVAGVVLGNKPWSDWIGAWYH